MIIIRVNTIGISKPNMSLGGTAKISIQLMKFMEERQHKALWNIHIPKYGLTGIRKLFTRVNFMQQNILAHCPKP